MSAEIFTLASMQKAELEGEESEESGVSFTEGDHPDLSICDLLDVRCFCTTSWQTCRSLCVCLFR